MAPQASEEAIRREIEQLEARLAEAQARLRAVEAAPAPGARSPALRPPPPPPPAPHFLLLLADSALPLGAFAFSSGLESFLAHGARRRGPAALAGFVPLSLASVGAGALPFVLAAHRDPGAVAALDDQLDAAAVCAVGRRASVAQGRALLAVWERSLAPALPRAAADAPALRRFAARLRAADAPPVSAHLAPLFGAVCALVGLGLRQTAYVFLLSHAKALLSAAVRAGVLGPYQAHRELAGEQLQRIIDAVVDREWQTPVEEAGQSVPVMDLWIGRHELLYSRIFNS